MQAQGGEARGHHGNRLMAMHGVQAEREREREREGVIREHIDTYM